MLKIRQLTKIYGEQVAVNNLSLEVKPGQAFGFLGVNGAGKTTTMKMMVGLLRPDFGEVLVGGKPASVAAREEIGFMPENPSFYGNLTAAEFLNFCAELFKFDQERKDQGWRNLLGRVDLIGVETKRIREYSKGMKQRLGFAQALVNNPSYLFLDEPLDGLDPLGRQDIKVIIKQLKSEGKTIFLNSHILSDIEEICDSIGILHGGQLLYSGTVKDFCQGRALEEMFVEIIRSQA